MWTSLVIPGQGLHCSSTLSGPLFLSHQTKGWEEVTQCSPSSETLRLIQKTCEQPLGQEQMTTHNHVPHDQIKPPSNSVEFGLQAKGWAPDLKL